MNVTFRLKKLTTAIAVALTISVVPMMSYDATFGSGIFMSEAVAASDHNSGHKGQGQQGVKGASTKQTGKGMRQGKKSITEILSSAESEEEDSDRPAWAGVPGKTGKPGSGSSGDTTKKGGDYGDIVVMLRNDDGTLVEVQQGEDVLTYAVSSTGELITIVNGEIPEGADVQAVEFGRLNIARAPSKVLDHSLAEALSKLDGLVLFDTVTLDASGRLVVDGFTIDSPLENLALYSALLTTPAVDGVITLSISVNKDGADTTYTFSLPESVRLDVAASALAAASDKTGELTIDEVVGISSFLGIDDELASLVTSYSYDRTTTYTGLAVDVLEAQADGSYLVVSKDILTTVDWNDVELNSIKDNVEATGIDIFTQAADDAVQVLEFVHDNAVD